MKLNKKHAHKLTLLTLLFGVAGLGLLVSSTPQQAAMKSVVSNETTTVEPGRVVGWSTNLSGETTVPVAAQTGITAISAGEAFSLALTQMGEVIGWGWNDYGQLNIPAAAKSDVIAIASGQVHSLALKSTGQVIGWGMNNGGQLNIPAAAQSGVIAISAGTNFSMALKDTGGVIVWGNISSVPVAAQSGVIAISAGFYHCLALKDTGEVIGWGDNAFGRATPPAATQSGVIAIAGGGTFSLVVKNTGEVIGWGDDYLGRLDIPVAAKSGVVAVVAGYGHGLALKSNGTVIGWGLNANGQTNIPGNLNSVRAIAAGTYHSLAIKPPNNAPVAVSKNITISAGANCSATITAAQVNNGSYDPDRDAIALSLDSNGPFGLGANTVMLTVTDSNGASNSTAATVTVVDTTKPTLTCPTNVVVTLPLNSMDTAMAVDYSSPTATDNCSNVMITPSKASGSVFPLGTTTVTLTATDGANNQTTCSFTVTVLYNFGGFQQPVDAAPAVNVMSAGRGVAVKFSLSGNKGLAIFAAGSPISVPLVCGTNVTDEVEETLTASNSALSYDAATDTYIYVWKTDKAWKGTCRQLQLKFNDGTTRVANFQFR